MSPTPQSAIDAHTEDQLRLMARVARMYHERGMRQGQIAAELHISQPRVSRLLKRAAEIGIVRTTVALPTGVYTDVEEALEQRFGLEQVVLVESAEGEDATPALGAAAAEYLSATLIGGDVVGISSWSASLLAAASAMRPFKTRVVESVVQLLGGLGDPRAQIQATRLIGQFGSHTGAEPVLLSTPGVLGSAQARDSLMADPSVSDVIALWDRLTVALVGIGAVEPSDLALQSGNTFSREDRQHLQDEGAVGDICFRFYGAEGAVVDSDFDARVIGISPEKLKAVPRRIAVAGGDRKLAAIRGALRGGWLTTLVTDLHTARRLLEEQATDGGTERRGGTQPIDPL